MSTSDDDAADTRRLKPPKGFVVPTTHSPGAEYHYPALPPDVRARKLPLWEKTKSYVYAFFAGIAAILIGILLWKSRDRGPDNLLDSVKVQKKRQRIAALRAEREVALASVEERQPEVAALDAEIVETKKKIIEIQEKAEGLSDAEAEEAFDRLGY